MKIINFEKRKMKLLTKEQQESYENAKTCYIKKICTNHEKIGKHAEE